MLKFSENAAHCWCSNGNAVNYDKMYSIRFRAGICNIQSCFVKCRKQQHISIDILLCSTSIVRCKFKFIYFYLLTETFWWRSCRFSQIMFIVISYENSSSNPMLFFENVFFPLLIPMFTMKHCPLLHCIFRSILILACYISLYKKMQLQHALRIFFQTSTGHFKFYWKIGAYNFILRGKTHRIILVEVFQLCHTENLVYFLEWAVIVGVAYIFGKTKLTQFVIAINFNKNRKKRRLKTFRTKKKIVGSFICWCGYDKQ